jgi:hypothetical protein
MYTLLNIIYTLQMLSLIYSKNKITPLVLISETKKRFFVSYQIIINSETKFSNKFDGFQKPIN